MTRRLEDILHVALKLPISSKALGHLTADAGQQHKQLLAPQNNTAKKNFCARCSTLKTQGEARVTQGSKAWSKCKCWRPCRAAN